MTYSNSENFSVSPEELESVYGKLSSFMEGLSGREAEIMTFILARAAAAKEDAREEVFDYLNLQMRELSVSERKAVSLPQLAKAVDGSSDLRTADWTYTIWSW
jgi:hypothetical protein